MLELPGLKENMGRMPSRGGVGLEVAQFWKPIKKAESILVSGSGKRARNYL